MSERRHDYVPTNAAQFNVFMDELIAYVVGKTTSVPAEWSHIPQDRMTELTAAFSAFQTAFNTANATPTPANINTRREAQADCTRILRAFVNQFLRFPPVTNSDRIAMHIPNHDTIRTDHKVVTEKVEFVIETRSAMELAVDFWQLGADHKAKPEGYDGAVLIWHFADTQPETVDVFEHHLMASRRPFPLHFEEADRGKKIWVTMAWQNSRGIRGEWAPMQSSIVP